MQPACSLHFVLSNYIFPLIEIILSSFIHLYSSFIHLFTTSVCCRARVITGKFICWFHYIIIMLYIPDYALKLSLVKTNQI